MSNERYWFEAEKVITSALKELDEGSMTVTELCEHIAPYWENNKCLSKIPLSNMRIGKIMTRLGYECWHSSRCRGYFLNPRNYVM